MLVSSFDSGIYPRCKWGINDITGTAYGDWSPGVETYYAATKEEKQKLLKTMPKYIKEWLEKQGEQKPTNKVEPKFKVGDWIVQENIGTFKVIEICESWYEVIDGEDNHYLISFDKEFTCHLWTVQNAKDGDVLVAEINKEPNDFIYIFKKYDQDLGFWSHCYLDAYTNKFHKGIYHNNYNVGVPATKEQRELLFQKMKEAGYEWDAEKKELKKIQKNLNWNEEDEKIKYEIEVILANTDFSRFALDYTFADMIDWLKSLNHKLSFHD